MERTSKSIIDYLPEDVLCQIFSHLHRLDILKSTSLICKLFCSLSSLLVHELTLKDSSLTCSDLQRLFKRFPCVKKIRIEFPKLDNALLAICNFDLNLEKLEFWLRDMNLQYPETQTMEIMSTSKVIKGIKSLLLYRFHRRIKWQQVVEFINLFPSLTELDIGNGYRLNDVLIQKVTSNLPNLRKIDLCCNHRLTDTTLDTLSSNCPKLEAVNFQMCERFTPEGLYKFFCNNPQLNSVHMPKYFLLAASISKVVKCMQVLQNLNHVSLEDDVVHDAVLVALAESRPPLKSLVISCYLSQKYTMTGLSRLLSTCPDLESLEVNLPDAESCSTHDGDMSIVVKRLPKLKHIVVWSCIVCQATLFSLVQNCPLLETILFMRMDNGSAKQALCDQEGIPRPTKKNYSIKFISVNVNTESDTWLLSTVEPYCPNLRKSKHFMDRWGVILDFTNISSFFRQNV
ncbi:hypothetical protein QQ045_019281 [Rhodiola kirilowii]